jgi:hypothetical protein
MTDRTALVAEKDAFAKRLAEAIRTQSLEGLERLPFDLNRLGIPILA